MAYEDLLDNQNAIINIEVYNQYWDSISLLEFSFHHDQEITFIPTANNTYDHLPVEIEIGKYLINSRGIGLYNYDIELKFDTTENPENVFSGSVYITVEKSVLQTLEIVSDFWTRLSD